MATGRAAGVISTNVAALMERVLKTMLLAKLKRGLLALLAVGALGFGCLFSLSRVPASDDPKDKRDPAPKAAPQETPAEARAKLQGTWVKTAEMYGGRRWRRKKYARSGGTLATTS
jgi:hypothetical protein